MKEVEQDMLGLLGVKLFKVYQSVDSGKEILASFKGGDPNDDDSIGIRVPFSQHYWPLMLRLARELLLLRSF